ncbi:MAG: hypothetical protein E7Z97_01485 [Propionibacteriaceae bacterium]|nr:hypothetical protein [Propionibacteriaceae bacterium]
MSQQRTAGAPPQRSGGARRHRPGRAGDERGSASLELVVVVPAAVLVIALVTAGWRLWSVRSQVREAAAAGARAASLARSAAEAELSAAAVVDSDLATMRSICTSPVVHVDASAFSAPTGDGDVTVDVSCRVPFTDLLVPMPGVLTVEGRAGSRLDSYRGRQP